MKPYIGTGFTLGRLAVVVVTAIAFLNMLMAVLIANIAVLPDAIWLGAIGCWLAVAGMGILSLVLLAVKETRSRKPATLLLICATLSCVWYWSRASHIQERNRWLLQDRLPGCQEVVRHIQANSRLLSSSVREWDEYSTGRTKVFASTNVDGSLRVWFAGIRGQAREGILFDAGPPLKRNPSSPSRPVVLLTNNWYFFY